MTDEEKTEHIEEIDLADIEQIEPEKVEMSGLLDELGELNDNEKAILERMRGAKKETIPVNINDVDSADPNANWISICVGQPLEVGGIKFKISHISAGFIILEMDETTRNDEPTEECVWEQLQCTGARSLIRIDGTPLYVETRILSSTKE